MRYIGVSNETSWGVSELVHAAKASGLSKIVSIQNCYSLLVRVPYETDLAETCRRHNVSLACCCSSNSSSCRQLQ